MGYNIKPQSRFSSPKADRPKSTSPNKRRIVSQPHQTNTSRFQMTPQRFHTPQRNVNCSSSVCHENYREKRVSHQERTIGRVNLRIVPNIQELIETQGQITTWEMVI